MPGLITANVSPSDMTIQNRTNTKHITYSKGGYMNIELVRETTTKGQYRKKTIAVCRGMRYSPGSATLIFTTETSETFSIHLTAEDIDFIGDRISGAK